MTRDIDDLILRLSRDVQPVAPGGVQRRLASFAAAGLVMSAALMLLWLGLRPDLGRAVLGTMLWEKGAYTLALAASGVLMTESLARPDGRTPRVAVAIALVAFGSIGFHGLVQMVGAGDAGARHLLLMGASARVCALYVFLISAPMLVLLLAGMRTLAPTRLRLAGFAAGLGAGGVGAFVYSLHCPETAAPFVAIWYSLGVAATAGLGWLTGPIALRWR